MSAMDATSSRGFTRYVVWVDEHPVFTTEGTLSEAVREWDRRTYDAGRTVPGGIAVQCFNSVGLMIRDGWIMHVKTDGTVYLSPHVETAG